MGLTQQQKLEAWRAKKAAEKAAKESKVRRQRSLCAVPATRHVPSLKQTAVLAATGHL